VSERKKKLRRPSLNKKKEKRTEETPLSTRGAGRASKGKKKKNRNSRGALFEDPQGGKGGKATGSLGNRGDVARLAARRRRAFCRLRVIQKSSARERSRSLISPPRGGDSLSKSKI